MIPPRVAIIGTCCDRRCCGYCEPFAKGGGYQWRCTRSGKPVRLRLAQYGELRRTKACLAATKELSPTETGSRYVAAGDRTNPAKAGKGTRS